MQPSAFLSPVATIVLAIYLPSWPPSWRTTPPYRCAVRSHNMLDAVLPHSPRRHLPRIFLPTPLVGFSSIFSVGGWRFTLSPLLRCFCPFSCPAVHLLSPPLSHLFLSSNRAGLIGFGRLGVLFPLLSKGCSSPAPSG